MRWAIIGRISCIRFDLTAEGYEGRLGLVYWMLV